MTVSVVTPEMLERARYLAFASVAKPKAEIKRSRKNARRALSKERGAFRQTATDKTRAGGGP